MTLSKEEFKAMVMLYAANIDGNIQSEELKVMLEKIDSETVEKAKKLFGKMSDKEVLDCIRENKAQYAATEADLLDLIHDLCAVIEADEKCTVMEEQMVKTLRRVIKENNNASNSIIIKLKNFWIQSRLQIHCWLTTTHLGYIKIALFFIIPLAAVMFFMWLCHSDIHGLYYFFNFNYPDVNSMSDKVVPTWGYLLIGIIGMLLVSGLLMMMFTNGIQRWVERIREGRKEFKWISDHYVMIGYNRQSLNIIKNLPLSSKNRLIILTKKFPVQVRAELQSTIDKNIEKHIILYAGGYERIYTLNLSKAKEVFILVGGNEWENQYTQSMAVLKEVACQVGERSEKLRTNMLINDITAYNLIERLNMPNFEGIGKLDIHPFNLYDNWARLLWSYNGLKETKEGKDSYKYDQLDFEPIENTDKHVHLVIVGFKSMGRALWQEAVRIAHFPNFDEKTSDNRTIITVIDPEMDVLEKQIRSQYPPLEQIPDIDFNFRKARIEDEDIRKLLSDLAQNDKKMLTIAICFPDPDASLSAALSLPERLYYSYSDLELEKEKDKFKITKNPTRTRILVWQAVSRNIEGLIGNYKHRYANLKFFGNLEDVFSTDLLDDNAAILVNGIYNYYNEQIKSNKQLTITESDLESKYPEWKRIWLEETSEQYKLSTRYQIDHYRTLLPILERNSTDDIKEKLAQTEHLRWIAERTLAGWRQKQNGEGRVDELMIHYDIIPRNELTDEKEKNKDINVVRFAKAVANTAKHLIEINKPK